MRCRTKRQRSLATLILGVMTVVMFGLTTAHFTGVNEYTFRIFLTDASGSLTRPSRNGDNSRYRV